MNKLPIVDITKFTFQDFPEHTACIVWFAGCNFRCPYCHNPEFITGNLQKIDEQKSFSCIKITSPCQIQFNGFDVANYDVYIKFYSVVTN